MALGTVILKQVFSWLLQAKDDVRELSVLVISGKGCEQIPPPHPNTMSMHCTLSWEKKVHLDPHPTHPLLVFCHLSAPPHSVKQSITPKLYSVFSCLTTIPYPHPPQAHIGAILLSKFTSYRDFHTQLYTCAAEFDFLPAEYVLKLTLTLLIPAALAAALFITKAVASQLLLNKLGLCVVS